MNQPTTLDVATVPFLRRAFDRWPTQLRHVLAPAIFFCVGFNSILWTKHIFGEHGIDFSGFITATLAKRCNGMSALCQKRTPPRLIAKQSNILDAQ